MKQFLTFLFIWFIPILSDASAKTNPIAGDRVNSLSSKTCNCFFDGQACINVLDHSVISPSNTLDGLQFGNSLAERTPITYDGQWQPITHISLILFGIILSIYLGLKLYTSRNRIRS